MYKISIIVPVFNAEETIETTFNSILNQTIGFNNLEVIFIDDCSSDNSFNIIEDYSLKYANVKVIKLKENSGFAGKPRNIGIKESTSDYIMFIDDDDIFVENACEVLFDAILYGTFDFVTGNYYWIENGEIIDNNWNVIKLEKNQEIFVSSINENIDLFLPAPSIFCKIIRKEFLLKNNIIFSENVPAQDLCFVFNCLMNASGIKFINVPIVEYKQKPNSITLKRDKKLLSGYIKSYKEGHDLFIKFNRGLTWIATRNLNFFIRQLVECDLSIADRIDLLKYGSFLFEEYRKSPYCNPPEDFKLIFDFIYKKDYLTAAQLTTFLFEDEKLKEFKLLNDLDIIDDDEEALNEKYAAVFKEYRDVFIKYSKLEHEKKYLKSSILKLEQENFYLEENQSVFKKIKRKWF